MAIGLRGHGHLLKGDCLAAIAAFHETLDLQRRLAAESEDVAIALNDLAGAERSSGDYATAWEHYHEALRVAQAVGYFEGVGYITGNLAGLAIDREDWSAAKILARNSLSLAENVHRQELIAANNYRLAYVLVHQGQTAEAQSYARRAVMIYARLGSPELAEAQAILDECGG